MITTMIDGKTTRFTARERIGTAPAVFLINPKYAHNVGTIMRNCSCYDVRQLWYTGDRVSLDPTDDYRLPREERMKGYRDVSIFQYDRPFDMFDKNVTTVAIELLENCESLPQFDHPENAVYVFGPEDGSIPSVMRRHCQRFVAIPTRHCLNVATAVATVLYDRQTKLHPNLTVFDTLVEERGHVLLA